MPALHDIARFLDGYFDAARYGADQRGVYRESARSVRRIGVALEARVGLGAWARSQRLNALFLHRPWRLDESELDRGVGVISYHLAFDESLTLGYSTRLAPALSMRNLEVIGEKEGRPLGMIGDVPLCSFDEFRSTLTEVFGGEEHAQEPAHEAARSAEGERTVARVAIMGAMNDSLVREADARGARVYVTGQWRVPAADAVYETGIGVVCVGHRRSEEWGLRALAGLLRERWASLRVVVAA